MLRSCSNFLNSQRIKSKAADCAFCFTCCGVVIFGSFACVSDLGILVNTLTVTEAGSCCQVCPVLCVLTGGVIVVHVCLQSDLKELAKAEQEKKTSTFVQQETNPISSKHSKILTL